MVHVFQNYFHKVTRSIIKINDTCIQIFQMNCYMDITLCCQDGLGTLGIVDIQSTGLANITSSNSSKISCNALKLITYISFIALQQSRNKKGIDYPLKFCITCIVAMVRQCVCKHAL